MSNIIEVIFFGDIVGKPGRQGVREYIKKLGNNRPDFIIGNVENASHGFGLTKKNYNELLSYGIDCFTSGNHIWDKREIFEYIEEADKLIRPINYPRETKGRGYRVIEKGEYKIGIINVLGRTYMNMYESPWELIDKAIDEIQKETPIIIMDIHAEATAEKICMGKYYAQKGITSVIGTHTHVQTADERIYEGRCAYITDVGFCGDTNGVIGMCYETSIKRLLTTIPERLEVATSGESQINGVRIRINPDKGEAEDIKRINEIININEEK